MLETRKEKEENYIKFRNMLNNFIRDVKDDLDTEELPSIHESVGGA